jgi:ParB family chromosome partitioning protein
MSSKNPNQPPTERNQLRNVSLFAENDDPLSSTTLPIEKIILPPSQPRRYFDPKAMQSLVESVKKDGILQPLLVRPVGDKYELVAGERRYRAAQEVGLTEVPVLKRELSPSQARQYTLTENLQREDLNPVEETEGILQLLALKLNTDTEGVISLLNQLANVKRGFTDNVVRSEKQHLIDEVFRGIGRLSAESFRTHRLPLLNLPMEVLDALRQGLIEYTKAKEIAKVKEDLVRQALLEEAIAQSLSLSQIRDRVKASRPNQEPGELKSRFEATYKQAKKNKELWDNPSKRQKLESLLTELEKLLNL